MRIIFAALLFCALMISPYRTRAQDASAVANRQQQLQSQLDQIEGQIAVQQSVLDAAQSQHKTLQGQIDQFNAQIKKTQLQIQAINLNVSKLNNDIDIHNETLSELSGKLEREQASLAQILRKIQMLDDYSLIHVALSSKDLGEFFIDVDAFASIQDALQDSFAEIRVTSASTAAEKEELESRRAEQEQLRTLQKIAQDSLQAQQKKKKQLLEETKGIESNYQKLIEANKKTAAQIRTELFQLAGGGGQIPLPTAITLAKQAGSATGIRPAFILGVLRQETNLGANVGQCLITNVPNKGDGKGKNTGTPIRGVMKPTRDVDPFFAITAGLGLDPYAMPVSCPQSTGYGGAMGPAQFIPSTWASYDARIAKLAGHYNTPANPWNNLDAFTAIALYMADLGAATQMPAAERTAALKYFAGSYYSNPRFAVYGDNVMQFAADFEQEIQILSGN